ncbi:hypothetical protein N7509_005386 [Penicillium cosmopolitanum]|uniref:Heterokaryon incompatibility domain-containing protein n=1 Tax=Penicillium cosmopolitanum TaxID=1131564 RepID=A0A9W9W2B9_9EURO|nr:uncharacterized protein N7509_005386 [Penicillium cosmopolitanum]KAJ5397273.1 hypothetical protein N7509_005386 [Penicillium cosmopolitanum]
MRLLRTDIPDSGILEIEEFSHADIPHYAILSHRWGAEEVTLQDIKSANTEGKGYKKIKGCCKIAKDEGLEFVWIDTCCIDKASSAELSEAINSMYFWYELADVCYAYLDDVSSRRRRSRRKKKEGESKKQRGRRGGRRKTESMIPESKWFKRGWTLQELIAPREVVFFDKRWKRLGDRTDLEDILSDRTGIPQSILSGKDSLGTISVAQRMSWAAGRQTSRIEDEAYCLMGIFGINMPLLYGERENAFVRLQEEILRVSDDLSLFAWRYKYGVGLLAPSPAAFLESTNIIRRRGSNNASNPPTVSSRGIYLEVHFIGIGPGLGLAVLDCQEEDNGEEKLLALYVQDIFLTGNLLFGENSLTMQQFARVNMERLDNIDLKKLKNYQCPVRRICVQTSHLRKLNFEDANQIHSVTYPKEVLTRLMGLSHLGALEYATAFRSEEKSVEITWLMLTRHDVERHLKTEKNPKVLFKAVESSHDSFFKMLVSRGAMLNSEGWTKIVRTAIDVGYIPMVKAILENHLMTNSSRAFGEEALEYAASSEKELLFDSILNLEILPTDGQLHRAAKKGHYYISLSYFSTGVQPLMRSKPSHLLIKMGPREDMFNYCEILSQN